MRGSRGRGCRPGCPGGVLGVGRQLGAQSQALPAAYCVGTGRPCPGGPAACGGHATAAASALTPGPLDSRVHTVNQHVLLPPSQKRTFFFCPKISAPCVVTCLRVPASSLFISLPNTQTVCSRHCSPRRRPRQPFLVLDRPLLPLVPGRLFSPVPGGEEASHRVVGLVQERCEKLRPGVLGGRDVTGPAVWAGGGTSGWRPRGGQHGVLSAPPAHQYSHSALWCTPERWRGTRRHSLASQRQTSRTKRNEGIRDAGV